MMMMMRKGGGGQQQQHAMGSAMSVLLICGGMMGYWAEVGLVHGKQDEVLPYYLQQQFGVNEFGMVGAARPAVNGTATGFGLEVVYEFWMTATADPASDPMGYVRGTAIVVNNTAASTTFFVNNVVHYEYNNVNGTLSQQGEAVFSLPPWEFAVVGGTGAFRGAFGYNVGTFVNSTSTPTGTHVTTHYEAHLSYRN